MFAQCNINKKLIFNDYEKFKKKLQKIFSVINEKQTTEQYIYVLQQNKFTVKYLTEF